MESDRVLRPLTEAGAAIEQLDTYESPAALMEALRATWHGVDRTLRTMLRENPTVPDALRLTALSQDLVTPDAVVHELRQRNMISLDLAGRVHELRQAVARAEVRAADADNARELVRLIRSEVAASTSRAGESAAQDGGASGPGVAAGATMGGASAGKRPNLAGDPAGGGHRDIGERPGDSRRRPLVLGAIAAVILIGTVLALHFSQRGSTMEEGIAAFRHDSMGTAERHFRSVLSKDRTSVTARLYLARVLREQGRHQEASEQLKEAVAAAPRDAAVRRELGYLFIDLDTPVPAAEQFEMAVEIEPSDPLNWVGLLEALTKAGDPRAAEMLRRAPAEAQAMVRSGRRNE